MRAKDIQIGQLYVAKVSGRITVVRVERESPYGGYDCTNITTGRSVRCRSAQRLRSIATPQQVERYRR